MYKKFIIYLIAFFLGIFIGFSFSLSYTGILLRDNLLFKIDSSYIYTVTEQIDWRMHKALIKLFPALDDYYFLEREDKKLK